MPAFVSGSVPLSVLQRRALRFVEAAFADLSRAVERTDDVPRAGVSAEQRYDSVVAEVLRQVVCAAQPTFSARLAGARLFRARSLWPELDGGLLTRASFAARDRLLELCTASSIVPETLGPIYEFLLAHGPRQDLAGSGTDIRPVRARKSLGAFFTPPELTRQVVSVALHPQLNHLARGSHSDREQALRQLRICDPAMGAGAFLIATARELSRACADPSGAEAAELVASILEHCLYGVDLNPLAVAVAELGLLLLDPLGLVDVEQLARHLRCGNALLDDAAPAEAGLRFEWREAFPEVFQAGGFDVIVGNPPWVAFAGRAAQPLPPGVRAYLSRHFGAFRGFPTLHGLFVERATQLAPRGTIALLLPSPVSDLDGYRPTRRALTARHRPREPLLEFGQDAFDAVTQPCFALVAEPAADAVAADAPWRLVERQKRGGSARSLEVPEVLLRLRERPPLPAACFGEMGFQSSRLVTERLLLRGDAADEQHTYPLLEGRDVREFWQGAPRLFLRVDRAILEQARCRVRPLEVYRRVAFVVRQTANVPIAALHGGLPFRNSLIAGFDHESWRAPVLVGLLNSSLYRALHVAARRDARQAAFPQVKVSHLRSLPAPPPKLVQSERLQELTRRATDTGCDAELRRAIDEVVFDWFELTPGEREVVLGFLAQRTRRPAAQRESDERTIVELG